LTDDQLKMRRLILAAILLAGCSDKPTPVMVPVTPRPVVEILPGAAAVLRTVAADSKLADPWWVRLSVSWHSDPFIHVDLDRKPPGPDDYTTEANGLKVVFARELLTYLRGCRVEAVRREQGIAFDVTFPNQDARESEAAARWLREETARHKSEGAKAK
jgi:Fe-S cluster assembly iron-binding protein IscA